MSRKPLPSYAVLFEDAGNPWVTREDWLREEKLAQKAYSQRTLESARAFVAPARKRDLKRARPKGQFWEISQKPEKSERVRQMEMQRENLKLMLAALGACDRTIAPIEPKPERPVRKLSHDEEMRFRNVADKPEPASYAPPKPLVETDTVKAARRAHWQDTLEYWRKSLARAQEIGDVAAEKRAKARIYAINVELELMG